MGRVARLGLGRQPGSGLSQARDPHVAASKIGIQGHSRYGKAAIVAMAYDPRIAIGFISSSGAGGAKLFHHYFGETLENVAAANEFHWMAGNFLKYAADPMSVKDLPVDMDALVALCAPRPLFHTARAPLSRAMPGWIPTACGCLRRAPIRSTGCWARPVWAATAIPLC